MFMRWVMEVWPLRLLKGLMAAASAIASSSAKRALLVALCCLRRG